MDWSTCRNWNEGKCDYRKYNSEGFLHCPIKCTCFKESEIKTRQEALDIAWKVAVRQRGRKQDALWLILGDYQVMLELNKEVYYKIMSNCICKTCGSQMFKKEHMFSRPSPGGNPMIGCVKCNKFSNSMQEIHSMMNRG